MGRDSSSVTIRKDGATLGETLGDIQRYPSIHPSIDDDDDDGRRRRTTTRS